MGFLSGLKSMFSNNKEKKAEDAIEYNGFSIIPTPIREGGQFRISAIITKGEGESLQTHTFIRSDTVASQEECIQLTIRKAKMTIDQSEDRIFN
jgi:hypothetical protein